MMRDENGSAQQVEMARRKAYTARMFRTTTLEFQKRTMDPKYAPQRDIADIARCENVVAKLGGLAMPDNGFGWNGAERPPTSDEFVAAQGRYYFHMIECFGPERCMFESNFPVDMVTCSYTVLWNSFKRLTAKFSAAEKAKLFHDTAARVYRL